MRVVLASLGHNRGKGVLCVNISKIENYEPDESNM